MNKRKIAVVTGTRAEYGLLHSLMQEIKNDPDLILQTIVTAAHLSPEFGFTYRLIEEDGFTINARVETLLSSDSSVGIVKSLGLGAISFAETLTHLAPDLLVVLGDRFEILAATQAATLLKIPVAHIHGGEVTEGALDESMRHAITKLAHIHFPVTEDYRRRILQLGEAPDRVFNFGAPGLDFLNQMEFVPRDTLEKMFDFKFRELNFLITYHPVTVKKEGLYDGLLQIFQALEHFPNAMVIFTKSNTDEAGRQIGTLLDQYVEKNPQRSKCFVSLGIKNYLSMAKQANIVLGNSSSGLIEIPHLKVATVNIGERQTGRSLASSVICCKENEDSIVAAINQALSPDFQKNLQHIQTPYAKQNASQQIKQKLKTIPLTELLIKRFFDIPFEYNL